MISTKMQPITTMLMMDPVFPFFFILPQETDEKQPENSRTGYSMIEYKAKGGTAGGLRRC